MIRNERQYRASIAQRDKLTSQLNEAEPTDVPEWVLNASRDAVASQIADIETELADYESLQSRQGQFLVADLADLPRELVRARIARHLSQRELAAMLNLKEQQVQRYEATDYAGASVTRIGEVMAALDMRLAGELSPIGSERERDRVRHSLAGIGLSSNTINSRFFASSSLSTGSWINAAARAARVFRTNVEEVLSGSIAVPVGSGAFRAVPAASHDRLTSYAVYAEYLAELAAKVCTVPYRPLPPIGELRESLRDELAVDPLRALLDVCWDHGIPVVPVTDSGSFYGACWFFDDRPAIVLKNQVRTPERWAFLLAHEMDHTSDSSGESVLESGLDVSAWRDLPLEKHADDAATRLLLGDDAEAMAQVAADMAKHSAAQLKEAVIGVAEAKNVAVGLLADFVAHRVSRPGVNWWPTANSLHSSHEDAWLITRSELFSRVSLDLLDELDRDILIDGMAP